MEHRFVARLGTSLSAVGLGTWQLGADWGDVAESQAQDVLEAALAEGITFFDTADVYGDGRSEQLIAKYVLPRAENVFVATKLGRRMEQTVENYRMENFRAWLDRSRRNLGVDTIDLVQLHCPPSGVYDNDEAFDSLDQLVAEGVIRHYGVSVVTRAEALKAIARPGVSTVQIIFNVFRQAPLDDVFGAAAAAGVGIIVRVPLASGLLSGRYTDDTVFAANDHRNQANTDWVPVREGETFAGVDFHTGVAAAREFAALCPDGVTPAQAALAWILRQPGVTSVIPGARSAAQVAANAAAATVALPDSFDSAARDLYDRYFRAAVHDRW
jgi:aryl-alcohol dehydrogenase-like predicted oxidoreductase